VALARALVGVPRLLLLDEPLSSLDPALRVSLRGELASLRRQLQLTMIYVTHDAEDAAILADRTVVMRKGRIGRTAQPAGKLESAQRPTSPRSSAARSARRR
jgi:ABC-type sugar transport system ATPase subunit